MQSKSTGLIGNGQQSRAVPRCVLAARLRRMRKLGALKIIRRTEIGVVDVRIGTYYEIRGNVEHWFAATFTPVTFTR